MEQKLARLAQLKVEGDMIMQELMAAGMPPEQIMAAVEGVDPVARSPVVDGSGMGAREVPDLPTMPQGLLGAV
jgi:uncharacterized protein (DUF111 family)